MGCSSLAAGMAGMAAADGHACLLVDLDEHGGGIDLLLGAERLTGWRWPRLAGAMGHLREDLWGRLPVVSGVRVLSMARGSDHRLPRPEAVAAVVPVEATAHATPPTTSSASPCILSPTPAAEDQTPVHDPADLPTQPSCGAHHPSAAPDHLTPMRTTGTPTKSRKTMR